MSLIRPEAAALLHRFRDTMTGLALALAGLWLLFKPGYVLPAFGLALVGVGIGLAVVGLRRMRFRAQGEMPGVVQVIEGQVGYFGPAGGGFVALDDLIALGITADGDHWRLTSVEGAVLIIPRAAKGAETLLDVFVRLPGLDPATLIRAAAAGPAATDRRLWQRKVAPLSLSLHP